MITVLNMVMSVLIIYHHIDPQHCEIGEGDAGDEDLQAFFEIKIIFLKIKVKNSFFKIKLNYIN